MTDWKVSVVKAIRDGETVYQAHAECELTSDDAKALVNHDATVGEQLNGYPASGVQIEMVSRGLTPYVKDAIERRLPDVDPWSLKDGA
jgi:hypothetical protein